jgi:protein O-mannosyl-transferase
VKFETEMKSGNPKRLGESRRTTLVCLLLAAATFTVYWQVSRFELTNFDEFTMILQNPYVLSGVTLPGLSWALTTSWFEYWHPLTWLSHMLDYELFGLSPGWYHLVNLGFHVANTLLLFAVLQRMTGALWRSAMVAALFALHPLHVESVAWIAERKDVLSGFFFMLTLWAYVRYAEERMQSAESGITHHASRFRFHTSRFYVLSLVFFACGLMSKPMVVTLPFVLLLLDYWPLGRSAECGVRGALSRITHHAPAAATRPAAPERERGGQRGESRFTLLPLLVEKLPFFALTVASCVVTYVGVKAGGSIISAETVSWSLRLANVPVSYVRYLGKLIWPTGLIALYPMPDHWAWWQVGGAVLVLVLISLWLALRARSAPYLIVGWLLFLGVLFPTIGLVQAGFQSIADRYTYIPSIGIFVAVVWAVAEWGRGWRSEGRGARGEANIDNLKSNIEPGAAGRGEAREGGTSNRVPAMLTGVAVVVLLLCSYLTWVQAGTWRNGYTLWTHCVAVYPDSFFARYNLGYALQHSDRTSEAIEQYRAALRLKPEHVDSNLNLGITLIASSRAQEATNYLGTATRIKPDYAKAQGAMGLALLELGDYAGAAARCAEAIRLDPAEFGPYVNMGRALSAQGKSDEALGYYAEGLRLMPGLPQIHYYLGLEWMKRGAFEQAASSFGEAVRLAPTWGEARAQQQLALKEAEKPQTNADSHR